MDYRSGKADPLRRLNDQDGSFLVAAILFIFVFFMIAGFAVDLSSYLNKKAKLQNMADGAAKTAGRALQQYRNNPNVTLVHQQVLNYIKQRQGREKLEMYPSSNQIKTGSNDLDDNIGVRKMVTNCGNPSASQHYYRTESGDTKPLPSCHGTTSDTFYLTGVAMLDHFSPLFMPDAVFGVNEGGMAAVSVAAVEPSTVKKVVQTPGNTVPLNCGLIADGTIEIHGNNFNTPYSNKVSQSGFCANADIDVSGSNNGNIGNVYTHGNFHPGGGTYGTIHEREPERTIPEFKYDKPSHPDYDVVLNDSTFESWPNQTAFLHPEKFDEVTPYFNRELALAYTGFTKLTSVATNEFYTTVTPSRAIAKNNKGSNDGETSCSECPITKEMLDKQGNPTGVNVTKVDDGKYVFSQGSTIEYSNSDPIGLYADADVTFSGNNHTVKGGLYATGDITVEKNNNVFKGVKSKLGGLAMWSEGNISVPMNNITLEGIVGAGNDFSFTGPPYGGGNDSGFEGMLVVGGNFQSNENSSNTDFLLDKSKFNYDAMNMNGFTKTLPGSKKQVGVRQPLFANVQVNLVN